MFDILWFFIKNLHVYFVQLIKYYISNLELYTYSLLTDVVAIDIVYQSKRIKDKHLTVSWINICIILVLNQYV